MLCERGSNVFQKDGALRRQGEGGGDSGGPLKVGTCRRTAPCVARRHWGASEHSLLLESVTYDMSQHASAGKDLKVHSLQIGRRGPLL